MLCKLQGREQICLHVKSCQLLHSTLEKFTSCQQRKSYCTTWLEIRSHVSQSNEMWLKNLRIWDAVMMEQLYFKIQVLYYMCKCLNLVQGAVHSSTTTGTGQQGTGELGFCYRLTLKQFNSVEYGCLYM